MVVIGTHGNHYQEFFLKKEFNIAIINSNYSNKAGR